MPQSSHRLRNVDDYAIQVGDLVKLDLPDCGGPVMIVTARSGDAGQPVQLTCCWWDAERKEHRQNTIPESCLEHVPRD